jgi:hypothetical protein
LDALLDRVNEPINDTWGTIDLLCVSVRSILLVEC